jgi:tRNA-2-methylthio-N6-dimethylallyladenosine synthase
LADLRLGGVPRVRTVFDIDEPRFLAAPTVLSSRATAFVTTMKGCNERCSFCIVPYTRGPERYRPSSEILQEIAALVEGGVREVTLLGQTVNSYRDPQGRLAVAPDARADDPDESEFAALLWAIAERVPRLSRLRYTSPHPRHLTASLIRAHRELELLPRHVHLPVQSGSDRMLKRMIRRHTRADYLERVVRLRAAVPGVTVSTDIIVGFPGETEDDFEATLSLVREAGHTGVFGFMYSERPHTPAQRLVNDVSEELKRDRLARLFALSEGQIREHLASLVGGVERVLVEGVSPKKPQNLSGRSGRNEIVHIEGAAGLDLVGEIVEVGITQAFKHSLCGRLLDDAPRPRRRALPVLSSVA